MAACFCPAAGLCGEIDAAELAATCRTAQASAFHGVAAAACEWYLDPCNACAPDAPPQRWCVPEGTTVAARADLLFERISANPAIGAQPASQVVEALLATHFPCPAPRYVIEEK
ncbi:MAG: Rap1a/Tai family immunity protein [Gammaproteobacteria bacterium]